MFGDNINSAQRVLASEMFTYGPKIDTSTLNFGAIWKALLQDWNPQDQIHHKFCYVLSKNKNSVEKDEQIQHFNPLQKLDKTSI